MSTIDIDARLTRVRPSTRLRLTVRGRRLLAFLAALPAVVAVSIATVSGGQALAAADGGAPAGTFEEVTVETGDTLWSIARSVAPAADPRDVIDDIVGLNALQSGALRAGQTIAIPMEYSDGT